MEDTRIDRREFTLAAVWAALAGVTVTITACGGGGGGTSPSTTTSGDRSGNIAGNHGHSAVITSAQLAAGNAVVITMQASATHNHDLTLTAAEVQNIAAGREVSKQSGLGDTDAHTHTVTFTAR